MYMKKFLLIIGLMILPIIVFAWNNTSIQFNPKDSILTLEQACIQRVSNWWNGSWYEQLEFNSNSKYNSVYGFKKMWNFLYFIALKWDSFTENNLVFTPSKSILYRYDCKKLKMKQIVEIQSQRHTIINSVISISNWYILFKNNAPEAGVVDYSVINMSTWKIFFLSSAILSPPGANYTFTHDVKNIKFWWVNSLKINTYENGIFEWNFQDNKIIKK